MRVDVIIYNYHWSINSYYEKIIWYPHIMKIVIGYTLIITAWVCYWVFYLQYVTKGSRYYTLNQANVFLRAPYWYRERPTNLSLSNCSLWRLLLSMKCVDVCWLKWPFSSSTTSNIFREHLLLRRERFRNIKDIPVFQTHFKINRLNQRKSQSLKSPI